MNVKLLAAAAAGVLFAAGDMGSAHATPAYAYAEIGFTNLTISGIVDATGAPVTGVSNLTSSVNGQSAADYANAAPAAFSKPGNLVTGVDVSQSTSGPGAFPGPNVFTQALTSSAGARGDGLISGALASGATANLVAEGNLIVGDASAGSSAGTSTIVRATFTALSSLQVTLTGTALAQMVTSVGLLGDNASAEVSASYTIKDTTTNSFVSICDVNVVPNVCSTNISPGALNASIGSIDPADPGSYSASDILDYVANLTAGHSYTLSLQEQVQENLSTIPEPASLALVGVGLAGLGGVVRRRRNS